MSESLLYRPSNPFRSANIRPGANAFVFSNEAVWPQLLEQLKAEQFCEIVGGHGTGKSTLLHQIIRVCESWDWIVHKHVVDGRRTSAQLSLPLSPTQPADNNREVLRTIDGFEQLSRRQRRDIRQHCERYGERLLITAHASEGGTLLHKTHVDLSIAQRVLESIAQREGRSLCVDDLSLTKLLRKHEGNLREVFFALFDVYSITGTNA